LASLKGAYFVQNSDYRIKKQRVEENMQSINSSLKAVFKHAEILTPEAVERGTCDDCNEEYTLYVSPCIGGERKGEPVFWKSGCKCANRRLAAEAIEKDKQLHARYIQRQFEENSLVSENLKRCTLQNFLPADPTQDKFLDLAKKFVERFRKGISYNLVLYGSYGVGKSHLAYGMCSGVLQRGFSVIFLSMPQLLKRLRDAYDLKNGDELKIYKLLQHVDFLVIDELGAEKKSEWTDDILLTIIESRAGKCTLYTTNLERDELQSRMTPRNFSKFSLDMQYFKINGQDYRIKSGKFEQSV
jgi:DNA replication protein DnaC